MSQNYPKTVYEEKMRAYLDTLREELDKMKDMLDQSIVVLNCADPAGTMKWVHDQADKTQNHLGEVEAAEIERWQYVRNRVEAACDDLLKAMNYLNERVTDNHDEV